MDAESPGFHAGGSGEIHLHVPELGLVLPEPPGLRCPQPIQTAHFLQLRIPCFDPAGCRSAPHPFPRRFDEGNPRDGQMPAAP